MLKSSIYGVTQQEMPESMIACKIYVVHSFFAFSIAIFNSSFFDHLICIVGVGLREHLILCHVDICMVCFAVFQTSDDSKVKSSLEQR
jgi:hypothetical protein